MTALQIFEAKRLLVLL